MERSDSYELLRKNLLCQNEYNCFVSKIYLEKYIGKRYLRKSETISRSFTYSEFQERLRQLRKYLIRTFNKKTWLIALQITSYQ